MFALKRGELARVAVTGEIALNPCRVQQVATGQVHRNLDSVNPNSIREDTPFVGAILTGGASSRMGTDKALLRVEGVPMALRVAHAILGAGAKEVCAVGGDAESLAALGLRTVPDEAPHQGPLAGIIAALHSAPYDVVVVAACDMPWIESSHVARLVTALSTRDAVLSAAHDQVQPLFSVWRRASCAQLDDAFRAGERSPRRALERLDYAVVNLDAGLWSVDLDTPEDFDGAIG